MTLLNTIDAGVLKLELTPNGVGGTVTGIKGTDEFEPEFCIVTDGDWVVLDYEQTVYILYNKETLTKDEAFEHLLDGFKAVTALALDEDEVEDMARNVTMA